MERTVSFGISTYVRWAFCNASCTMICVRLSAISSGSISILRIKCPVTILVSCSTTEETAPYRFRKCRTNRSSRDWSVGVPSKISGAFSAVKADTFPEGILAGGSVFSSSPRSKTRVAPSASIAASAFFIISFTGKICVVSPADFPAPADFFFKGNSAVTSGTACRTGTFLRRGRTGISAVTSAFTPACRDLPPTPYTINRHTIKNRIATAATTI